MTLNYKPDSPHTEQLKTPKVRKFRTLKKRILSSQPVRLLAVATVSVFMAESIIMFLLSVLPPMSMVMTAFIDFVLIVGVFVLVLYLSYYRPLQRLVLKHAQIEESLQSSWKKLLEAQSIAKLGHYVLDIRKDEWTSSTQLDNIFGIDSKFQRNTAGWLQIVHPEFTKTMSSYLQNDIMLKHGNFDREYKIIDVSTGQEKWVHGLGSLRFDGNGNPIEMFGTIQDITERKQTEVILRRYETIVSNSSDMLAMMDEHFIFLAVNERYAAAFGKTCSELVGHAVSVILEETYIETVIRPNAERCLQGHEVCHQNWVNFPALGNRFMEVHYTPYNDHDNKISGFIINGRDITERHQIEESLRESEEKFRTLVESANIIPWRFDLKENQFTFMGKQAEKLLGYPVESWTDMDSWVNRIHADDRSAAKELCISATSRGEDHDFQYRCITSSGEIVWLRDIVSVRKDDNGVPCELVGHMINITERKLAEESNTRLSRAIEQADETIVITDAEGSIQYVNPAFERMTGYTKEETIGQNPRILKSGQQDDTFYRGMWETLASGKEWSGEIINKKKDGTLFTEHTVISPVFDLQGKIVNYVAAKNDITEMKRLQELESRAARLETAGIIAGQVAHDFNNLLAPIMAYPELIHEAIPENHKAHEYLEVIENSASKIADINQDLLTMGRRGYYNLEVIDLNLIVRQAVLEMVSGAGKVSIEMMLCDDLLKIKGGAAQIHRMLSNLLVNALDAIRNVGQITIETENYYADCAKSKFSRVPRGEYIRLTISDSGCGIPNDIVHKILDPFFSTKTADKKRGSGLGLSVVDAVMKDHNGYIDLSSKVGQGTSFYLYFPVTKEETKEETKEDDSERYVGGSEKVLIVDDDETQCEVSSRLLTKIGYEVSSVESGEKAIEFLKKNPQELIILDMVMPDGMDGAETYRNILEINPHQKAIILSGFSATERVLEAQKLGAGAFVQKPVTKHDIAAAVRTELDRKVEAVITA